VFATLEGERWTLHTAAADGSHEQAIPGELPPEAFHPDWAPDGTTIVFDAGPAGNKDVYTVDVDGSGVTRITSSAAWDYQPTWSPDGTRIAYVHTTGDNDDIWVMNADGSDPVRLTTDRDFDLQPTWSPDGSRIAFQSNRSGNPEIYVMRADGRNVERITDNEGYDGAPDWSPDGARIAFASDRNGPGIYVMSETGGAIRKLVDAEQVGPLEPVWSPDGNSLAYTADRSPGSTGIFVMDLRTGVVATVVEPGSICCISWLASAEEVSDALPFDGLRIGRDIDAGGWVVLQDQWGTWVAGGGELMSVGGDVHRVATGSWDYDFVQLGEYGEGAIFVASGTTLWIVEARLGEVSAQLDMRDVGYVDGILQDDVRTWVTASSDDGGQVLARIDPDTGKVLERYEIGQGVHDLAEADGSIFVASREDERALVRVDPALDGVTRVPGAPQGPIAAVGSHVWIATGDGVTCLDAITFASCGRLDIPRANDIAAAQGRLWVLSGTGSSSSSRYLPDPDQPAMVTVVDGRSGDVLAGPLAVPDTSPATISAFEDHAWVGFHDSGHVFRIDLCVPGTC
jgi:dipeptidyl aminopeptidase/acylaminoacyl peptidase